MPSAIASIDALRDAIAAHLAAQADFAGATVLSRQTASPLNEIAQSLGRLGVLVLVIVTRAVPSPAATRRPILDPVEFQIRCLEDPLLNQSGKSATFLAERALAHLALWRPALEEVPGAYPLLPAAPGLVELNRLPGLPGLEEDQEIHGWDCHFTTKLFLSPA